MNFFDKSKLTNENLIKIFVMVILYVLLGNINSLVPNPMIPGAVVAVNMIIVVLSGILFGKEVGLITGLMGTAINAVITGSSFEYASIIPHLIMGWAAGKIKDKSGLLGSSLSIIIGHALNIIAYLISGLMTATDINSTFWKGRGYEAIFGVISIVILVWLYLRIFPEKKKGK